MTDLNWNALYSFWLVAEHGSFSAAARSLPRGTTQALFKRVKQLEQPQSLGLKLFRSRGVKGVELTEGGTRLHRFLDPTFRAFDTVTSELRGEDRGPLIFAMPGYCAYNYGSEIIRRFHKHYPNVDLSIRVRSGADTMSMLEKGHVDFGLCTAPGGTKFLTASAKCPLPIEIIAPQRHHLANGQITWKDVVREPLILPARDSVFRLELERLLQRKGLLSMCRVAGDINEGELAVASVRSGAGVAIIGVGPRLLRHLHGLKRVMPPPGLPKLEIALLHRSDRYLPNYMRAFQRTVRGVIS